ncbi:hypothetical protein [Paraburkholderia fungorum]|uniref:hypothetical protein n=1 Tax=Paraburkholderia fungorum TaxID=134537 RepID=UPI0038BB5B38
MTHDVKIIFRPGKVVEVQTGHEQCILIKDWAGNEFAKRAVMSRKMQKFADLLHGRKGGRVWSSD